MIRYEPLYDNEISDKVLAHQYQNRFEYGPIKRRIIEYRYRKAKEKKIRDDFENIRRCDIIR